MLLMLYLHTQAFSTADYLLWDHISAQHTLRTNVTFKCRGCLIEWHLLLTLHANL